jgi:glycosyltransferase involved in cell wall biosynthesis
MQPFERSLVDMFVPVSAAVERDNQLLEQRLPSTVIPNFVPDNVAQLRDDDAPSLRSVPAGPFWLFVGALSRNKGIDVLLAAYERLSSPLPLVLIGMAWADTPSRFPPNTYVLDGIPHREVMAAWHRAAIGVVPSVFPDPCPTVAAEAMASGVPLVASNVGGLPDLVAHGETGLLVDPGNAEQLAFAIRTLDSDPAMADRMGEAAKLRVRSFMATSVTDAIEEIYEQVSRPS